MLHINAGLTEASMEKHWHQLCASKATSETSCLSMFGHLTGDVLSTIDEDTSANMQGPIRSCQKVQLFVALVF
jgi:hypothetical protein